MLDFIVVDGDEDRAVLAEEFAQQLQSRHHHVAPFVVTGEIFAIDDFP